MTLDPAAHGWRCSSTPAAPRRAGDRLPPWARIVCEIAQDYKCDLTYEAAVFAAMYKLVEAKVVGVLAAAGAIAQNAGRMYVCEDDVTLAKKLKLKPGRRHR